MVVVVVDEIMTTSHASNSRARGHGSAQEVGRGGSPHHKLKASACMAST
jgi:hypothetical protein